MHRRDPAQQARRKFYKTKRWERFSKAFRDRHPLCAECLRQGFTAKADDVHHRLPIQDGSVSPFDEDYLEALCKGCHAKATLAEQRARDNGQSIRAEPRHADDDRWVVA